MSESSRPTLAVIVGAGASVASGVPNSAELLDVVLNALISRVRTEKRDSIEEVTFPLREVLEAGLSARGEEGFESIVAALEELLSYGLGEGPLLQAFTELRPHVRDIARTDVLFGAHESVIQAILAALRAGVPRTPIHVAAHDSLCAFVRRLASFARIVLVTLNFDALLDDVLEWNDGFVANGDAYKEFDPRRWYERVSQDHLLMHVHGSVRFGMRPSTHMQVNVPFSEPVRYPTQAIAARMQTHASSPSADGQLLMASPIIAGGHKSPKLMLNSRPFAYYNGTALEAISKADRLLILGYGFGDAHVNVWIDEYLRIRERSNIAIVGYRTGREIGENLMPTERYLRKLTPQGVDDIYVGIEGGAKPFRGSHGSLGSAYFVASGVPIASDAEEALIHYLFGRRA